MKQKYHYLAAVGITVALLSSTSYAQNGQQILKKTIDLYMKAKSIQTVMVTKASMKLDGKTRTENTRHTSAFLKPNSFHFEVGPIGGKVAVKMASNGSVMTVYDIGKNTYFQLKPSPTAGPQAPIAGRPEQTAQMLAMLFPSAPKVKTIGPNYALSHSQSRAEGEAKQAMTATLIVDKNSGQIRSLAVTVSMSNKGRSLENEQSFIVESQQLNATINPSMFALEVPKGVKKVAPPKAPPASHGAPGGPSGGAPGGPGGPKR